MKAFLLIMLCGISVQMLAANSTANSKAVKTCFLKYKNAINTNNGSLAYKSIDSNTVNYFTRIKKMVDFGTPKEVQQLDILEQYFVLCMRNALPRENTKKWKGAQVYKFLVENGLLNKDIFKNATINYVEVEGNYAYAALIIKQQETNEKIEFAKENEVWKLDLKKLMTYSKSLLQKSFEESGKTTTDFLTDIVQKNTHIEVTNQIWVPFVAK